MLQNPQTHTKKKLRKTGKKCFYLNTGRLIKTHLTWILNYRLKELHTFPFYCRTRTTGGYVFTGVCLLTGGGRGGVQLLSGPWSFFGGYPLVMSPFRPGGSPSPVTGPVQSPARGYPIVLSLVPLQVLPGRGVPQPGWCNPHPPWQEKSHPPPGQESACYIVGGKPLAITQDFHVLLYISKTKARVGEGGLVGRKVGGGLKLNSLWELSENSEQIFIGFARNAWKGGTWSSQHISYSYSYVVILVRSTGRQCPYLQIKI